MKLLFLIPARGGSKGSPGKNLKRFGGIPLVGRAARLAQHSGRLIGFPYRVICSTDDPVIADTAREWGAEIPFLRPPELATDTAPSVDVIIHALRTLYPDHFDLVVLLQPTSPLTASSDVQAAVALAVSTGSPVVSVCPADHPLEWHFTINPKGILVPIQASSIPGCRQEALPTNRLNGSVYVATPKQIEVSCGFIGPETRAFIMPPERSMDIDTPSDWRIAEGVLANRPIASVPLCHRKVGPGQPCFVIAEAGVNHNGSLDLALKLVDVASEAGADAVKFQTFRTHRLATPDAPKAAYQRETTGEEESQYEMLRRLELDETAHKALMARCFERGIAFLSSPFEEESADLLEALGIPAFKIPSGELTNLPFLYHVARKGKPVILSSGMSTLPEVAAAVDALEGSAGLVLLHCVSAYPADPADVNLRAMDTLREAFGVPVGYSDHTLGPEVSLAAVSRGACVIEKHFTLDRSLPGPDHRASADPEELKALISGIRMLEKAMGDGVKKPAASESDTARVARKSLVAALDIPAGSRLEVSMVTLRRPGSGMPAARLAEAIGRRTCRDIPCGALLNPEMFE